MTIIITLLIAFANVIVIIIFDPVTRLGTLLPRGASFVAYCFLCRIFTAFGGVSCYTTVLAIVTQEFPTNYATVIVSQQSSALSPRVTLFESEEVERTEFRYHFWYTGLSLSLYVLQKKAIRIIAFSVVCEYTNQFFL